ncbi:YcnI family copper-binding membrane protein [Cryobacterium tepidiphilum]|nr:YcnI family protein [Cryobacterium tepidiphilum]
MKLRTPARAATGLAAGALLAVAVPLSASAHIHVDPSSAPAGSSAVLTFTLPHGCDGSATTAISIEIPKGITGVTPTAKAGWNVEKVAVDLDKPLDDGHGNTITTRTGSIRYTADTPLADGLRDTFALSVPLPADAAGESLQFPVLQACESGTVEWNETQKAGAEEPEHPAPAVTVTAATPGEHSDDGDGDAAQAVQAAPATDAASQATPTAGDDILARVLGIGGLVVGAVGIVVALTARRRA